MSSSAHSLLPMPLSPRISTPRPSRSTSTPWTVARSARWNSRRAVSLAIAVPVDVGVDQQRHARGVWQASSSSGTGRSPAVSRMQGMSCARMAAAIAAALCGVAALEKPDFAFAEHQHAAGADVFREPRQREPGLLHVRAAHKALQTLAPGHDLDHQLAGVAIGFEERADGHSRRGGHGRRLTVPVPRARRRRRRRRINTLRPSVSTLRNSRNGSPLAASSMAAFSTDIGLNCARETRTTRGPLAAPVPRTARVRAAAATGSRRRLRSSHFPFSFAAWC